MARAFRWQPAAITRDVDLARSAGLEVQRAIVVDDELRSSVPGVYAVGECAQHRDVVYGLWAPLLEQARVAGASLAGAPAAFRGAVPATTLKVAGVDLFCGGKASAGRARRRGGDRARHTPRALSPAAPARRQAGRHHPARRSTRCPCATRASHRSPAPAGGSARSDAAIALATSRSRAATTAAPSLRDERNGRHSYAAPSCCGEHDRPAPERRRQCFHGNARDDDRRSVLVLQPAAPPDPQDRHARGDQMAIVKPPLLGPGRVTDAAPACTRWSISAPPGHQPPRRMSERAPASSLSTQGTVFPEPAAT
jgi:pyridine nucleotide-disulfide oxidoreductase